LHEKGYVHGDLKPENIIVEVKENQLKWFYDVTLIDFQISTPYLYTGKLSGKTFHIKETDTGAFMGTLLYCSWRAIRKKKLCR